MTPAETRASLRSGPVRRGAYGLGMTYTADHVHFVERSGTGVSLFRVELPGLSYDGRVLIPDLEDTPAAREWVADRLNIEAQKLGDNALMGRMASPMPLGGVSRR